MYQYLFVGYDLSEILYAFFISMHLILPFDDVVDNQSNYTYHMMVDFFHLSPNIVELNLFLFSKNAKYMKLYRFTSMMMECNWIFRLENSIFCYGSVWNHVWEVFFLFIFVYYICVDKSFFSFREMILD